MHNTTAVAVVLETTIFEVCKKKKKTTRQSDATRHVKNRTLEYALILLQKKWDMTIQGKRRQPRFQRFHPSRIINCCDMAVCSETHLHRVIVFFYCISHDWSNLFIVEDAEEDGGRKERWFTDCDSCPHLEDETWLEQIEENRRIKAKLDHQDVDTPNDFLIQLAISILKMVGIQKNACGASGKDSQYDTEKYKNWTMTEQERYRERERETQTSRF